MTKIIEVHGKYEQKLYFWDTASETLVWHVNAVHWGTHLFTIFLGPYSSQSYTLNREDLEVEVRGTPVCSIWRSKKSERPITFYLRSRKERARGIKDWLCGQDNTNFLGLHGGSFQGNSHVPFARCSTDRCRDYDIFFLNATTCEKLIDWQDNRCIYICRKINRRAVVPANTPSVLLANWDGSGCAASGCAGSAGSSAGSAFGMIWTVTTVASVATPPTPAWTCCHASVWVFWVAHFRA